jgi:hypothetical protein
MLQGARAGTLKGLRPYSLHGERYYEVHYVIAGESGSPVRAARLPHDALYPDPRPGDAVRLHFVVNMLVKVEVAEGSLAPG